MMKWFYLFGFLCGVFVVLCVGALLIHQIFDHEEGWRRTLGFLLVLGFATFVMLKSFWQEKNLK